MKKENNEFNQWQINEINSASEEADACDFASEGGVRVLINKWKILESNCNAENKKNHD